MAIFSWLAAQLFFGNLSAGKFVNSGDQFFPLSFSEIFSSAFSLRKSVDLGVLNGWQFTTQFWDSLFYLLIYPTKLSYSSVQIAHSTLVIFTSVFVSYFGFRSVGQRYHQGPSRIHCLVITFLYCFNPYVMELWHGGVFNLGLAITYGLAPYIFYKFDQILLSSFDLKDASKCALALAAASFTFWLFAPLAFGLLILLFVRIAQNRKKWLIILTNAIKLGVLYIPAVAYVIYPILYELLNNASDNNGSFNPTYGNMQGGIWYQILMRHSWAIYTEWFPRSLYPFASHFFSSYYVFSILALYGLLLVGITLMYRDSHQKCGSGFWASVHKLIPYSNMGKNSSVNQWTGSMVVPAILILLISIFLAKGAQQPLGFIFKYLYQYVPLFSVFRTPDIRFGFLIILCICLIWVYVCQYFNKLFFSIALVVIVLVSSWPLFSGLAIRGENVPGKFYDRIVEIPQDQKSLSAYINQNSLEGFYTLPVPGADYGTFALKKEDVLIGQDLLSKQINQPFIYTATSGGISKAALERLNFCVNNGDLECLSDFPIQYVLFRNDLPNLDELLRDKVSGQYKQVYVNPTYSLYEVSPMTSIIGPEDISFERLSPTSYQLSISAAKQNQKLIFRQNFSNHWKIIEADKSICEKTPWTFYGLACELKHWFSRAKKVALNQFQFEGTHHQCIGYANCWDIKVSSESRLFQYEVIYYPQIYYQICGLISLVMILIFNIIIFRSLKDKD